MEIFNKNNYCVILAGGKGRRLWPYSRMEYPKQFIDFFGTGRTQLQSTFDRFARLLPLENILVCTNREYADMVRQQLPDLPKNNLLAEPLGRNTAPSVAWAHSRVRRENTDANIIVVPSDQMVINEDAFAHYVLEAFEFVSHHDLVLSLGVKPTRCEPGYGYIQMGEESDTKGVYKVQSFTEKPDREFAQLFMDSGEFLWNTGIFLWKGETMGHHLSEMAHRPDEPVEKVAKQMVTVAEEMAYIRSCIPEGLPRSIDLLVLEHCDNVVVQECEFGWADVGCWTELRDVLHTDADGNALSGGAKVMLQGTQNCVIALPRHMKAIIAGLDGYVVSEQNGILMICPNNDPDAIRRLINEGIFF